MLYFRLNSDNFIPIQQKCPVSYYQNGELITSSVNNISIDLGEIMSYFIEKLNTELGINNIFGPSSLYEILKVPCDAYSIDDESKNNSDCALRYILLEYSKKPIKELDNKSLHDLGIEIEFCKNISQNEHNQLINNSKQKDELSVFTEEVLWKNLTDKEKVNKFSLYLSEISSVNKELIIIDPYLFKDESNDYCDMLSSVIDKANASSIIVITEKKNYKKSCYRKVANKINKQIVTKYTNDFHDRFWISDRKKGFYTGTSFNGIGKKISLINLLKESEVTEIINDLSQKSLI